MSQKKCNLVFQILVSKICMYLIVIIFLKNNIVLCIIFKEEKGMFINIIYVMM